MQKEYEVVIADTSCLILLDKIGELQLLQLLFEKVTITEQIFEEFGQQLPDWFTIRSVEKVSFQHALDLDIGEASAITLALELDSVLLVLDDYKARKVAEKAGLDITGTLGLFLKAKNINIIDSVKPLLEKIQLTNFRYSKKIFEQILSLAGETLEAGH